MGKKLKNVEIVVEDIYGVCLWQMPDGAYLGDDDGRFLCMEGNLNDFIVEKKMMQAAKSYIGDEALTGEAFWMPGSRKISDNESDDQMERLLDGKIPDPVDQVKQIHRQGLV